MSVINLMLGVLVVAVFFLTGCGGGGGASVATVYGTASEGALIAGKTVKLKDANGSSAADTTTDQTDGSYSIDVTGLTPPFLLTVHGSNGYYLSLAPSAGKANINPITTTVVALAAGGADLPALFASFTPGQLAAINSGYTAKCALLTASLQSLLPHGLGVEAYFTRTIAAGSGMDGLFDRYLITVDPVAGITIKTNDAVAFTLLSIPLTTIAANTNQSLPTITSTSAPVIWLDQTATNVWTVYGRGLDRIGGITLRIGYETTLQNPVVNPGSVVSGAQTVANLTTPGVVRFGAVSTRPFSKSSGDIVSVSFGSGAGKVTGMSVQLATVNDSTPEPVPVDPFILDTFSTGPTSTSSTEGYPAQMGEISGTQY